MTDRKKKVRANIRDEPRITPDLVRKLMAVSLGNSLQIPDVATLNRLSVLLENWRQHYIGFQIFDPLKNEAAISANRLILALNKLKEEYGAGLVAVPELKNKLEAIESSIFEIRRLYTVGIAVETGRVAGWIWLSEALIGDFAEAVRTANPGREFGISDNGPLTRFIAEVVPHLTGEHPTAQSISTQLKNLRKKGFIGKNSRTRITG